MRVGLNAASRRAAMLISNSRAPITLPAGMPSMTMPKMRPTGKARKTVKGERLSPHGSDSCPSLYDRWQNFRRDWPELSSEGRPAGAGIA